jgi:hypothetical protein
MELNVIFLVFTQNDTNWFRGLRDAEEKCNHNNDFFEIETEFVRNVIGV